MKDAPIYSVVDCRPLRLSQTHLDDPASWSGPSSKLTSYPSQARGTSPWSIFLRASSPWSFLSRHGGGTDAGPGDFILRGHAARTNGEHRRDTDEVSATCAFPD